MRTNPNPTPTNDGFARGWYDMMVKIWTDRLSLMNIHRTGALRRSVEKAGFRQDRDNLELSYHFLRYGLYVDAGTGNGYKHGNGGKLEILEKEYRRMHHLGEPRKRRPWFSVSWRISVEVLKNQRARAYGVEFARAFDNL